MKYLIFIALSFSLSGCATVGGALQQIGNSANQANANGPNPWNTTNCQSYVYGNSVSTSCY